MQLYKIVPRALSETETKTIEHFRYYYNRKKCFALIGDHVAVTLPDGLSRDLDRLMQEARDRMSRLLDAPPDFSTYVMDDAYGLVAMGEEIYAISPEPLSAEETEGGKVSIATALAIRSLCLDACSAGQIIAVNDEELTEA